ncbi:MAG: hypothetical protein Q8P17_03435 [bacterium]|nr:hypothetical protein [bacterium]
MKNPFENIFKKNTPPKPEEGLTVPGAEHEGHKEFSIEYKGDTSMFKIRQSIYDEFLKTAEERNCHFSDLLRAGLDKYGFSTGVFEKIIAEKEDNLTMPQPEHEGHKEFTIEYKGDTSMFKIKRSLYDRFLSTAKERGSRPDDLLRAGLDRYGFGTDVFEKIINEK